MNFTRHMRDRKWLYAALLASCLLGLFLRVYLPYDRVFGHDYVRFPGNDPWFHMRVVDNLTQNFPRLPTPDPYFAFPDGAQPAAGPLFDWVVAGLIWVVTLGRPTIGTAEPIAAWVPVLLGLVVLILTFRAGQLLWDAPAALLATLLLATMPGAFFMRSALGFVDQHVLETLLATALLVLVLAGLKRDFSSGSTAGLVASIGVVLSLYVLTWPGSLFLVLVLAAAFLAETVVAARQAHLRKRLLWLLAGLAVAVPPIRGLAPAVGGAGASGDTLIGLCLLAATVAVLGSLFARQRWLFRGAVLLSGALGLLAVIFYGDVLPALHGYLQSMTQGGDPRVQELEPLFEVAGRFSLRRSWNQFGLSFYLALGGFLLSSIRAVKLRRPGELFFLVWAALLLFATAASVRFAYYSAIPVALLAASFLTSTFSVPRRLSGRGRRGRPFPASPRLVTGLVLLLTLGINLRLLRSQAAQPSGPDPVWRHALEWFREATPEPFGDAAYYLSAYPRQLNFDSWESAYTVLTWWDYGYWLARIGRRVPVSNPSQSRADLAARFLVAESPPEALNLLERTRARYVIVNTELLAFHRAGEEAIRGAFPAVATWARLPQNDYFEAFLQRDQSGRLRPLVLYYPAFYRSMLSRLLTFGGQAYQPENSTWVISYAEGSDGRGPYKEITEARRFETYEEARLFSRAISGRLHVLAGLNPLYSCVPLEETEYLASRYQSRAVLRWEGTFLPPQEIPRIRIFERVDRLPTEITERPQRSQR